MTGAMAIDPFWNTERSPRIEGLEIVGKNILRRAVFGKLLELEDLPLSEADEALVEFRFAAHRADPKSSVPLEEMKRRLRS